MVNIVYMATEPNIEEFFLVSDSDETSSQLDSKKMSWDVLTELAQDNLFKRYLNMMDKYLTKSQYETFGSAIANNLNELNEDWNQIKDKRWSGLLKPVDGQVIAIFKDDIPNGTTPMDYLKAHWDIPIAATVNQWKDCMMRGVTFKEENNTNPTMRSSNQKVTLKEINMPPHMHHSGITQGSTVQVVKSDQNAEDAHMEPFSTRYDMFDNDSIGTGLSKNELQGVGENLAVEQVGSDETSDGSPALSHNNLPNLHECYVFEILLNQD